MNISFILGVLSTLATEFVIMVILGIYLAMIDKKKGGGINAEENSPAPATDYDSGGKWSDGMC